MRLESTFPTHRRIKNDQISHVKEITEIPVTEIAESQHPYTDALGWSPRKILKELGQRIHPKALKQEKEKIPVDPVAGQHRDIDATGMEEEKILELLGYDVQATKNSWLNLLKVVLLSATLLISSDSIFDNNKLEPATIQHSADRFPTPETSPLPLRGTVFFDARHLATSHNK